jgi:hypothetical protein
MTRVRPTGALIAAGTIVAILVGSSGGLALADPGGSSTVSRSSSCSSNPPFEICIDSMSVFNVTETPSGIVNLVNNSRLSVVVTQDGQVFMTRSLSEQRHLTLISGETQVLHQDRSVVLTFPGDDITCTQEIFFQLANGQVLIDHQTDFVCTQ